jgi:hypothetical protein
MLLPFDQMESVLRYKQPERKTLRKPKVYINDAPDDFNKYIIWLVRKGADFEVKSDTYGTYYVKSNISDVVFFDKPLLAD